MTAENILSKLAKVKKTGQNRWIACCPAHGDKHASLSIRELDDGRTLLHCFAECDTSDTLQSLGLAYWDLYPHAAGFHKPKERRPFAPMDVLRALAQEALMAATAASNIAKGMELSEEARDRLWTAATRLQKGYEVAAGD